jgi:hypothetical protein
VEQGGRPAWLLEDRGFEPAVHVWMSPSVQGFF